jgi:archaellum biogenesis protein FlaJ (TadC family)
LTYSFWFATDGAGCYIVIPHTFTVVSKYILFWHSFRSDICSDCVHGGRKTAFFLLLQILVLFSGRTCIIIPLGGQRHLVLPF